MVRRRRRKWSATPAYAGKILFPNRLRILSIVIGAVFVVITMRLFQLQVVQGDDFTKMIQNQVASNTELTARRGDILVRDTKTAELRKLALNTSLDELRVDAQVTPDKQLVADLLAPLIFQEEDYEKCKEDIVFCPEGSVIIPEPEISEGGEIIVTDPLLPDFATAVEKKKEEIYRQINTENRYVLLKRELSPEVSERIRELKEKFSDEHRRDRARLYAERKNVDEAIPDYFRGVILEPKARRYYPENELAAQVIGFVNHEGLGQYGIEGKMKTLLAGQKGIFSGKTDTLGRSIGLSIEDFQKAVDGSDIVLTLDRLIQQQVEEILAAAVQRFRADAGQVIVMDPKTGFILAMANYPTFDPNKFGNVYLTRRTTAEDFNRIFKTTPLFKKDPEDPTKLTPATFEEYTEAWKLEFDPEFYIYENFVGPNAYVNKTIQEVYEPGSVFKPIIMATALNENEVRPSTQYYEDKPIEVDVGGRLVPIRNADKEYKGWQTMTNVLERSANVGMSFVAKKLGKGVMYENIRNFGFGKPTYVELEEEQPGTVNYYTQWSTAALLNAAFGQGLTATPLQMATAWSALANGGLLPEPHLIAEIHHPDGRIEKIQPKHKTVLKADTAATITAMLVSAVNNGYASTARIPGYDVAGKTGTSQIARTDGVGYEDTSQEGSTITGFAGYAPADDPRFVVLVKFDRPRFGSADNTWGSNTAAPVFKEITQWLLDYYEIPANS